MYFYEASRIFGTKKESNGIVLERGRKKVGVILEETTGVRQKRKQEANAAKRKVLVVVLLAVLIAGGGFFAYAMYQRHQIKELLAAEGIYQNVSIDGIDMTGKSQEEALAILQQKYDAQGEKLTLQYEQETWEYTFADLEAGYHLAEAVEAAYQTGRSGTEEENYQVGKTLLKDNINIELEYSYNQDLLGTKLDEIATQFNREAVDSTLSRQNGTFVVTPEQSGRVMNREQTLQNAVQVMESHTSGTAQIVADVQEPTITAEANGHVKDLIGSFKTTYTMSDPNRNKNLAVGCNYINGTVIAPGETFSANENLGPQTYAGGYTDAAVYNNGKVESGVAGGVCQVTTTLYNAAIMAELEIVERHPHSMTVGYVPLGRDAAVAGTYKDLKFKNNTPYPIYIEAYASGGNLVMNIYGEETHSSGHSVSYETVYEGTVPKPAEVVTEDPNMAEGERVVTSRGRTGAKVSVYKIVYENGAQVSREWFSSSSYRAAADYVTVGTKKAEPAMAQEDAQTTE